MPVAHIHRLDRLLERAPSVHSQLVFQLVLRRLILQGRLGPCLFVLAKALRLILSLFHVMIFKFDFHLFIIGIHVFFFDLCGKVFIQVLLKLRLHI